MPRVCAVSIVTSRLLAREITAHQANVFAPLVARRWNQGRNHGKKDCCKTSW